MHSFPLTHLPFALAESLLFVMLRPAGKNRKFDTQINFGNSTNAGNAIREMEDANGGSARLYEERNRTDTESRRSLLSVKDLAAKVRCRTLAHAMNLMCLKFDASMQHKIWSLPANAENMTQG
jgi:hypothetical protein